MTIVVVQCRLSSTRLPQKALLPLGDKPLLSWVLDSMKQVPADRYVLAVDYDSKDELEPIARECNWECFAGPKDDVLERFCMVAKWTDCLMPDDLILRATADNPFLFYEAATQLLQEARKNPSDYITYTGLPHGSGVEVFNARSLIEACGMTDSPYDHEHVGPAFYNHPKDFASVMLPAPARWNHPDYRTTIDTYEDYRRALRIVRCVSGERNLRRPYTTEEICSAFTNDSVIHPVLCVPSIKKGHGTGHLRRCLDIASKIACDIYIPSDASLSECDDLIEEAKQHGLEDWQIVNELSDSCSYDLVLTDMFSMQKDFVKKLSNIGPVASIDEGSQFTAYCDYLLDIIPSVKLNRLPNARNTGFIPLPKNRKEINEAKEDKETSIDSIGDKVLISVGGEDPSSLSIPTAIAFAECGKNVTVIVTEPAKQKDKIPEKLQKRIRIVPPVNNLREKLYMYDIVVTHYGFTAFEALAAGCGVILLPTSSLHILLAEHYGFALLRQDELSPFFIEKILSKPELLFPSEIKNELLENSDETLPDYVRRLAAGKKILCPVCGNQKKNSAPDTIIARTKDRTYRRCNNCGMLYMSWTFSDKIPKYVSSYFFEDYKKQYGRTYLEDFPAIKMQCVHRMSIIDSLFWMHSHKKVRLRKSSSLTPAVLDIGCAMGPFL
ncbi:MAG: NTP transferase domain-containing protein, partial [Spirochaetaceae bacterium]|nr:NTP transferase domain-containing protein [Spirochaetaceae bacterium]